jgi:hypothetical protein
MVDESMRNIVEVSPNLNGSVYHKRLARNRQRFGKWRPLYISKIESMNFCGAVCRPLFPRFCCEKERLSWCKSKVRAQEKSVGIRTDHMTYTERE